ncbi:competence type IV pilus minor pilin ComGF [Staphylococcus simulans]|nr:competence type IV pilus minor pilin ComGF [Staphylococcus simulans]
MKKLINQFVLKVMKLKVNTVLKSNIKRLKAFTFIEMIFALCIFSITMSLIPPLFKSVKTLNKHMDDASLIHYEFFAQDISREINHIPINKINVSTKRITIEEGDKRVSYIFSNHKIYKNINSRGNITLIQNISDFKVTKVDNKYLKVEMTLIEKDEKYYKVLYL